MKQIKKLLLATFITGSVLATSGCTISDGGKLKDIIGTYELSRYTTTTYNGESVNYMEEHNVKVYLVISGNENGYFAYKDDSLENYVFNPIQITYNYDSEDSTKLNGIEYKSPRNDNSHVPSVFTNHRLGFKHKSYNLNYQMIATQLNKKGYYLDYTRISKKATLSNLNATLHTSFEDISYEESLYDGYFLYQPSSYNAEHMYDYYLIDLDVRNKTAKEYYALHSDKNPQEKASTSFEVNKRDGLKYVTVNGVEYLGSIYGSSLDFLALMYVSEDDPIYNESRTYYYYEKSQYTVDDLIQSALNAATEYENQE